MSDARHISIPVADGELQALAVGQGEPVLLLHGWALDHRIFDKQLADLSDKYQLIAVDRRGFGQSRAPADLRQEVDDILAVLDAMGLERVHLFGMSQGGRIALRFAARHPEKIRSLVVQSPALDGFVASERAGETIPVDEYTKLVASGDLELVRRRWLEHPMMHIDSAEDRQHLEDMLADCCFTDLQSPDPASYDWPDDVAAGLSDLSCPALVLMGDRDTVARLSVASELTRIIPGAMLRLIPGGGHLVNLTHAVEFNNALREFLASS